MSAVTIQFGQCGNQIGYEWFSGLNRDNGLQTGKGLCVLRDGYYSQDNFEKWFHLPIDDQHAISRCVLVDTEDRVINNVCAKASATQCWKYNADNIICRNEGGSGNNWSLGYCERGPRFLYSVLDSVRREVEKCDRMCILHNILSCAGGTGSGLGSRVIEELQLEYPSKNIMNSVVFPFERGEINTQNYNVMLTLSKLYEVSDIHTIFFNDELYDICSNRCGNEAIQFQDLNSVIAAKLLSFLQPVQNCSQNFFSTIISDLVPHPSYKLVSVKSAPHIPRQSYEMSVSWNSLLKYTINLLCELVPVKCNSTMRLMYKAEHLFLKIMSCVANVLITRGSGNVINDDINKLRDTNLYPKWISADSCFHHYHQEERLLEFDKFASLVSNNSSINESLNCIAEKVWKQFTHKAYLHLYTKYGLEDEDILASFIKFEEIIDNYSNILT